MHQLSVREQEAEIVDRKLSRGPRVSPDGAVEHQLLLFLQLDDALLDRVLDDEAGGVNRLELTQSVRTVDGLHFSGRVPPPGYLAFY